MMLCSKHWDTSDRAGLFQPYVRWRDAGYFYQRDPADREIGRCPPGHIKAEPAGMIAAADKGMAGGLEGTDAPAPELQVSEPADGEGKPDGKNRPDPSPAAKFDM